MNISKYIDHTLLKATTTKEQILQLCKEAVEYNFYAVCVNGCYVSLAKEYLKESNVKVAAVVGFPLGAMDVKSKVAEALNCMANGADEIDMVLNIGLLKSGDYEAAYEELKIMKETIGNKVLKVILETCYLTKEEIITASNLALKANADFIKTSSGFGTGGAELEDVKLMKEIVGEKAQVKASGGIKDYTIALKFIEAGATRLGTSSGVKIIKRNKDGNFMDY
ncbi:deoxyribose-phosphate aldolase [Pseudotenacibaculum sp. MALMAid0570]|uniref:deoxyribose-phosphate aldolase n=1 Tax=Pseudotenacibaculum sp. MALMAid0570 TaxID=3143938 RepID=UPI0032DF0310